MKLKTIALTLIGISSITALPATAKDLYMLSHFPDSNSHNELGTINLETKEYKKLEDVTAGAGLEVANQKIYITISSGSEFSLWTTNLDGSDAQIFNNVPFAGSMPISVNKNTDDVYISSYQQDAIAQIYPDYSGTPGGAVEGEDYTLVYHPVEEGCKAGCDPTATAIDEENERFYFALGTGESTKIMSSALGDDTTVDRSEELTEADGLNHTEHYHKINAINIDPKSKYMYFSNEHSIFRARINKNNPKVELLYTTDYTLGINDMVVDFEADTIYWTLDENKKLYSSDINGNNVEVIFESEDKVMYQLAFKK
ncbi:hypothetical protein [Vibrio sp. RE88]|uniref:hypothetical protein n=1 Tax=Vibrio sp. RE88 TaxID=2607610 RepID=UPI001493C8AF|nr:hypothetical protein [Vibrio sp. RE88]NOH60411.1 hypothetical protein [Vibrio sp. RE88]